MQNKSSAWSICSGLLELILFSSFLQLRSAVAGLQLSDLGSLTRVSGVKQIQTTVSGVLLTKPKRWEGGPWASCHAACMPGYPSMMAVTGLQVQSFHLHWHHTSHCPFGQCKSQGQVLNRSRRELLNDVDAGGISKLGDSVTVCHVTCRSPDALSGGVGVDKHVCPTQFSFLRLLWVPFSAHPLNAGIF